MEEPQERLGSDHRGPRGALLNLYVDSSALVKRFIDEEGSALVIESMEEAERWVVARIGFTETLGTILVGAEAAERLRSDLERTWQSFAVIDLSQPLASMAATLMGETGLRALDAIHLASAEAVPAPNRVLATFDRRLWDVARDRGHDLLPERRP